MLKFIALAAVSALALTAVSLPASARNNGGAIAAGVVGGLAVGAIIGSQANRGGYYGPGYYGEPGLCAGLQQLPHRARAGGRPIRPLPHPPHSRLRLILPVRQIVD